MYDFVIHAFLFTGALLGTLIFSAALFFTPVIIVHEVWAIITNSINAQNEENES